ncbi:MAG: AAA family ATPase [Euryarchaeota archaeon]|nr:AAA family ATPase [Euryarchaeota archaeon]MDE1836986.1 AAA family ATPase [Euryarchaeota archaeon]MDE1881571.1 AAA family ATPase [Euryarchaeota archaeon]MDE2046362.1 AAA family ATPase [Thermoplasmata archaeon]
MAGSPAPPLATSSAVPFVGRTRETNVLEEALRRAQNGEGSTWLLEGPGGIGKTRLARWLESRARAEGFRTLWGYCLKQALSPFFPFEQIFRHEPERGRIAGEGPPSADLASEDLPTVTIFESDRPTEMLHRVSRLSSRHATLLATRDRPAALRPRLPGLAEGARLLWLTRSEGEGCVNPSDLDGLGKRVEDHLRQHPGGLAGIAGLEYLVSQRDFTSVLRLVQFLRDVAESAGGHLFVNLLPAGLERRETTLLEAEGEVVRPEAALPVQGPTPPAVTLLRYLNILERDATRERPFLLVLDDVQWADPASLEALLFLSRNTQRLPVLIVGTLRSEEVPLESEGGDPKVLEVLEHMEREGSMQRLTLRGLSRNEIVQVAEGLLEAKLELSSRDQEFLRSLERTAGNPYFVLSMVRMLADQGFLRREGTEARLVGGEEGRFSTLPDSIRRVVERQFSSLPPESRTVLEVASVMGEEFDLSALSGVLGRPRDPLEAVVRTLEREHHFLQPSLEGENGWSFSHPLAWEVIAGQIGPERYRSISRELAEWWARSRPGDAENIARLYHQARAPEPGLDWVRRLVQKALRLPSDQLAERYHRWLQDLLAEQGKTADARVEEGLEIVHYIGSAIGPCEGVRGILRRLSQLPASDVPKWRIRDWAIRFHSVVDPKEAVRRMEALRAEIDRSGTPLPPLVQAHLELTHAVALAGQGRYLEGMEPLSRAIELQDPTHPATERALAALFQGVFLAAASPEEGLAKLREGKALATASGARLLSFLFLRYEGTLARYWGQLTQAVRSLDASILESRTNGAIEWLEIVLLDKTMVLTERGELPAARECWQEARDLAQKFQHPVGLCYVTLAEGYMLTAEGRSREALPLLEEAHQRFRSLGQLEGYRNCGLSLVEVLEDLGEWERADALLPKLVEEVLEPWPLAWADLLKARMAEHRGEPDRAREFLQEARDYSTTGQHRLMLARTLREQARWEERHRSKENASRLERESATLYREIGARPFSAQHS